MKFTSALKLKLIYVFRINDTAHLGCLKIGEATSDNENIWGLEPNSRALNEAAKKRINQYTQTAGISYDLLYTEVSIYTKKGNICGFSDAEVHNVLVRSGIKRKTFDTQNKANEWFFSDLETVKNAIKSVKDGKDSLGAHQISTDKTPIVFRPEQKEAIDKTKKQFKKSNEMLWYAKMRFGKTLSALQVVKDLEFGRTLILTHRPVVDAGWFEDFGKIFTEKDTQFKYGSKTKGDAFYTLEKQCQKGNFNYVYFASMQDLRGSELVGGNFDKNNELFDTKWDFIIVDEAHEGTQTELGRNVMATLSKPETKVLHLSGTPFNLLDNYKEEEIYTWDYVMEQRAKADWDKVHFGDPNPYTSLPRLNIFTYDLGKLLTKYIDEDVAFNFHEFFRVNKEGTFLHDGDVRSFLNLITKADDNSNYPYATEAYRNNFRHSLWMVPGVKEALALSTMLQLHPVFSQFKIVNVAGDGDIDDVKANQESLEKVKAAIGKNPHETYTITLSCGRLTTGVSVPAWTTVFMLSGSFNTSASAYMQTIFRVQTPATINGRVKEECFVFDFAPDRTLKVIAETAKISAKAGKTTSKDRDIMGEFLNFCPIISVEGSRMSTYSVEGMLEQLKKVYIERVVRNGFEDNHLYNNDSLMKLDAFELNDFDNLKGIIGSTKAMPKSGDIDINKQGFSNEEYEALEDAEKKSRKKEELTEAQKRLLKEKEEKRKNRDSAVSILRGISIRMPLLIYGADVNDEKEEITIDNFAQLIDPQSWEEFMPKGVSKQLFNSFKKYYEPDVFRAAGKRIRAMARAADHLTIEERIGRITAIFNTFRNPDKETVLTPWRVVNMHVGDCMGGYVFYDETMENTIELPRFVDQGQVTKNVFNADSRILEINSKSGLYPLYMTYGIYRTRLAADDPMGLNPTPTLEQQLALWDKTLAENIYVICKTPMAKSITKRTLAGFRKAKVNTRYFEDLINQIINKPTNFIDKVKQGKTYWKANNNDNMKFNAIVSNPPYQDTTEKTSDNPIYHLFMDIAFKISDKVSFITPARFLFDAGKTPKEWNKKILNDEHFKVVWYKSKSTEVFPNVDIKGGVAVTFRDKSQIFGKIGNFTSHDEIQEILNKVLRGDFETLSELVYAPESYRFSKKLHVDYPEIESLLSKGHLYDLTSNIFEKLDNVFYDIRPTDGKNYIQIYGRINNSRCLKWIRREYVDSHENIDLYKVFLPKSNGTGTLGEKLSNPIIGEPMIGHNQTFISIGAFNSVEEANHLLKYIKSKFARLLLGSLKVTQDNKKDVWKNIPLQDFTSASDIDWSQSLADIDRQLYAKYELSEEEVAFIEGMIKVMG